MARPKPLPKRPNASGTKIRTKGMTFEKIDFGNTLDNFLSDCASLTKVVGGSNVRGTVTENTPILAQALANYIGYNVDVNGVRYGPQT